MVFYFGAWSASYRLIIPAAVAEKLFVSLHFIPAAVLLFETLPSGVAGSSKEESLI